VSAGWNARPDLRAKARRMWDDQRPRREIAHALGVSEETVSHWRWEDGWPPRRDYASRPIRSPKTFRGEPTPLLWRCPACHGRATAPEGHASCHPNTEAA